MENLIQSDVFFFITSIAVVVVTIFILVILWYIVRILKNVKDVSDVIKKESIFVLGDLSSLGAKIKKFLQFFTIRCDKKTGASCREKTTTTSTKAKIKKE